MERKVRRVAIAKLPGRPYGVFQYAVGGLNPSDAFQLGAQNVVLEFYLTGVADVLPLAAAAGAEVRARRLDPQRRGFEDLGHSPLQQVLPPLHHRDPRHLALDTRPREHGDPRPVA